MSCHSLQVRGSETVRQMVQAKGVLRSLAVTTNRTKVPIAAKVCVKTSRDVLLTVAVSVAVMAEHSKLLADGDGAGQKASLSLRAAGPSGVRAFVGDAAVKHLRLTAALPTRRTRASLATRSAFVLVPTGDGSCDHLDDQSISLPSEIELKSGLFEVGREWPADIVVAVPTVSTRHAMLRLENNKVSVTDLSSTNGTYIDDEELVPLRAVEMAIGTEVTFGDMFLAKFKLEERS